MYTIEKRWLSWKQNGKQLKNGEQTTEMYKYNEKQFYTKLSEEEVNKQFDSLYLTADVPEPSITEQINNISDVLNDVLDRMDELESKGE